MSFGNCSRWSRYAAMLLIASVMHSALSVRADVERGDASGNSARLIEGDGFSVRVLIEPTIIRSSDRLRITLEVIRESAMIRGYDIEVEDHPVWMVQRRSTAHREALSGSTRTEFVLEPYLVGDWPTPRFIVNPTKYDGTQGEKLVVEPIEVSVLSVLGDEEGLIAEMLGVVAPPDHEGSAARNTLIVTIALGGVLLGSLAIALALRRRSAGEPIESCDAVAMRRLDDLCGSGLMRAATMDRYYFELTAILREYIEQRFGVNAPDRTTEEFLRDPALSSVLTDREYHELGALLEHADAVKFARATVGPDEAMHSLTMAKGFISRSARSGEAAGITAAEVGQ